MPQQKLASNFAQNCDVCGILNDTEQLTFYSIGGPCAYALRLGSRVRVTAVRKDELKAEFKKNRKIVVCKFQSGVKLW